ncbi:MAG: hypothetical protein U1F41_10215 [Burkholderiales bacterium]
MTAPRDAVAQILIAQFDDFDAAHDAAGDLRTFGVAQGDMEIFHLNAPGQHDRRPIGGDEDADRGAREGDQGQLTGAAVGGAAGLAVGAAAIPVVGPLAAAAGLAVGAYTGSLHGALHKLGDTPGAIEAPARPAGVRLSVHVLTPASRELVLATFRRHGARSIEEAEGTWRDGTWVEFDPVSTPRWLVEPSPP